MNLRRVFWPAFFFVGLTRDELNHTVNQIHHVFFDMTVVFLDDDYENVEQLVICRISGMKQLPSYKPVGPNRPSRRQVSTEVGC